MKTDTQKSHPTPDQNSADNHERHISGSINVRGVIETQTPPDLIKRHEAERNEDNTSEKKHFVVEIITLISVLAVAALTLWQGCINNDIKRIAQDTFNASERPYVGVESVVVSYESFDKNGKVTVSRDYSSNATQFEVQSNIKNFGPVPGTKFNSQWALFIDDKRMEPLKVPEFERIIFPTQEVQFRGGISGDTFQKVIAGKIIAEIEIRISYEGPGGSSYDYCSRRRFLPPGRFVDLGKCTHQW